MKKLRNSKLESNGLMNGIVLFPVFRDESARTSSLCAGTCAGWCCARPRPRLRTMVTINIFCSPRAPTAADPRRSSGLRSPAQVRIYSHFVTRDILPPTLHPYPQFLSFQIDMHWTKYFRTSNWVLVSRHTHPKKTKKNSVLCFIKQTNVLAGWLSHKSCAGRY